MITIGTACKATNVFLMAQLCIVFKKIKYVAKQLYLQCRELGAPVEYLIPSCLYEKEPLQLCFIELQKKAVIFLCQNLIMRCFVTILAKIYGDLIFFRSCPGFVNRTQSNPGFVNLIRSRFCQSDLIRSRFCKCPNKLHYEHSPTGYVLHL